MGQILCCCINKLRTEPTTNKHATIPSNIILTEESSRAKQPKSCNVQLWPHQLAMVKACCDVERHMKREKIINAAGVLCDRPGAGKTNIILALALEDAPRLCTIVVVPQNILTQWHEAAINFAAPGLMRVGVIDSYPPVAALLNSPSKILHKYDIVLTTSLYFNVIAQAMRSNNVFAHRLVFDEVDSIANMLMTVFPTHFTWFVSATVLDNFAIQKSTNTDTKTQSSQLETEHCDRQYYAVNAGRAVHIQCDSAFIDTSIKLPEPVFHTVTVVNVIVDIVLAGMLSREELAGVNARCYKSIRFANPTRVPQNDTDAVQVLLADSVSIIDQYKDVDEYELSEEQERLIQFNKDRVVTILMRLTEHDHCTICYNPLDAKRVVVRCCNQTFCEQCLQKWREKSDNCPACRVHLQSHVPIEYSSIIPIRGQMPEMPEMPEKISDENLALAMGQSGCKIAALMMFLVERTRDSSPRIIVCSKYDDSFRVVKQQLRQLNIAYADLDGGNVRELDAAQQDFRCGRKPILLINTEFYGMGMNLECAKDIVFMHQMKPYMMKQVLGRAQRPGRQCQLKVWSLLFGNEVEAKHVSM